MADRGLNPLKWKRRHLVTWAVLALLGAAGGMLFGWAISPFSRSGDQGTLFLAWLHYPLAYWPYAAAGAVTVALAYYAADLLTGAR